MAVERESAEINSQITLRSKFQYSQTGDYFDPSAISKVEILDSNGVTVLQTLTGASIIKDAVGQYHVTASAITTPKTIYDKWYFTPSAGAIAITKTNPCIVWRSTAVTLSSAVAICNQALSHLKMKPISSLNDATESARCLNRIYDPSRDTLLRAKHWRFATVKQALVEVSDQEVPGWDYVYAYPVNCLKIQKVFYDVESKNPAPIDYETMYLPAINQKVIVCNYDDAYIEYTYRVIDPTQFDESFIMAFSFLLAAQIAAPLTGNDKIATLMLQIYGSMVSDAGRINDGEKYIKPTESSSFEDAR